MIPNVIILATDIYVYKNKLFSQYCFKFFEKNIIALNNVIIFLLYILQFEIHVSTVESRELLCVEDRDISVVFATFHIF